jgi:hypothetical protein
MFSRSLVSVSSPVHSCLDTCCASGVPLLRGLLTPHAERRPQLRNAPNEDVIDDCHHDH